MLENSIGNSKDKSASLGNSGNMVGEKKQVWLIIFEFWSWCRLKFVKSFRHMVDKRIVEGNECREMSKCDNLMNNNRGPIPSVVYTVCYDNHNI